MVEAQSVRGGLDLDKGDRWADLKGPGTTARRHGFGPVGKMESVRVKQESDIIRSALKNILVTVRMY